MRIREILIVCTSFSFYFFSVRKSIKILYVYDAYLERSRYHEIYSRTTYSKADDGKYCLWSRLSWPSETNVQATVRARVLVERREMQNAYRSVTGIVGMHSRHRDARRRVMQLTTGQRCAAVGFIKQLYLDRPGVTGLKIRAINSQSARVLPLCWGNRWWFWQLAEKRLFSCSPVGFPISNADNYLESIGWLYSQLQYTVLYDINSHLYLSKSNVYLLFFYHF